MNDWLNLLGLANKAGKVITGEDKIINHIKNNKISLVIVATDSSPNTQKKYNDKCAYYNTKCLVYGTVEEISKAIGKNNRVAIGISDTGFTKGLLAKITK